MEEQTIMWAGASGKNYKYWITSIDSTFKDEPANYIFAKKTSSNQWIPIYIGETESLKDRLANHEELSCIKRHGGTHIHSHTTPGGEDIRRSEEEDLLAKWNPPCNRK